MARMSVSRRQPEVASGCAARSARMLALAATSTLRKSDCTCSGADVLMLHQAIEILAGDASVADTGGTTPLNSEVLRLIGFSQIKIRDGLKPWTVRTAP